MQGLERVYYDLDNIRKRLVRLVEMERLPELSGVALMSPILKLLETVNGYIEAGVEIDGGTEAPGGNGGVATGAQETSV